MSALGVWAQHSASTNTSVHPRYVYFQSYCEPDPPLALPIARSRERVRCRADTRDSQYLRAGLAGGYMQGDAEAAAARALRGLLPEGRRYLLDCMCASL